MTVMTQKKGCPATSKATVSDKENNTTPHIPEITEDTDTIGAALAYAKSGLYVGPCKNGTKNPGGVLGNDWHRKTTRDPHEIVDLWAGTDHGIFIHAGRSGLIILDIDHPEHLPEGVRKHLASAPFQETRIDTPGKGHAVFAVPPGRTLGNSNGKLGTAWGEVRGLNGVIIVAPSRHKEEDGQYRWLRTGPIPVLPEPLAARLPDGNTAEDSATDAQVQGALTAARGLSRPGALKGVVTAWNRGMGRGQSRHQLAIETVCWAARESLAGWYPLDSALRDLRALFVDAMAVPCGSGRVLDSRRAGREFDGIVAWSVGQALADPERISKMREGELQDIDLPEPAPTAGMNLPEEFWSARPVLGHIRAVAHQRLVSADVVLHCVMARLVSVLDHGVHVRSARGSASLNFFTIPVGPSGAGKTLAVGIASELIARPVGLASDAYLDMVPVGSGEGLAEMFMGTVSEEDADGKTRKVRKQVRHNAAVYVDEGELLVKVGQRSGSTTMSALRIAWVGGTLGQMNAREDTTRLIEAKSYALGLIMGFQMSTIGDILDDSGSGTAQRMLFCSALDPSIPDEPAEDVPMTLPNLDHAIDWGHRGEHLELRIPAEADVELRRATLAVNRGDADADAELDRHRPLHMMKLSALLALLDHRCEVTGDDWELARTMWATSCAVRDACFRAVQEERSMQARARDDRTVAVAVRSEIEKIGAVEAKADKDVIAVAAALARKVHGGGVEISASVLRRGVRISRRQHVEDALAYAVGMDWLLMQETDGPRGAGRSFRPGGSQPSA